MRNYTLITGASSGIGLELATIAARDKQNLVLVARDEPKLKTLTQQFTKAGIKAECLAIDLAKPGAAKKVFAFCKEKKLAVNTLVNNAGFGDYGNFVDSDISRQLSMISLNVSSLTELTHLFLPAMIAAHSGKIMNVGSVAGFLPGPLMSVYFATKNYVVSFSRALHEELRGTGVSVTCLAPGATSTGFGKAAHVSEGHSTAHPKTTAKGVAEFGWYQMQNGEPLAIYGIGNRIMLQATKFVPKNMLATLVKKFQ